MGAGKSLQERVEPVREFLRKHGLAATLTLGIAAIPIGCGAIHTVASTVERGQQRTWSFPASSHDGAIYNEFRHPKTLDYLRHRFSFSGRNPGGAVYRNDDGSLSFYQIGEHKNKVLARENARIYRQLGEAIAEQNLWCAYQVLSQPEALDHLERRQQEKAVAVIGRAAEGPGQNDRQAFQLLGTLQGSFGASGVSDYDPSYEEYVEFFEESHPGEFVGEYHWHGPANAVDLKDERRKVRQLVLVPGGGKVKVYDIGSDGDVDQFAIHLKPIGRRP